MEQLHKIQLQNNENIVLQSQLTSGVDKDDAQGLNEQQFLKNNFQTTDLLEQFNFEGLTADQIRELMAAGQESLEQDSESD